MKIQPPTINIFEKAVRKAGKGLVRDFGETENLQIQSKNLGDFVTKADLKAEKELLDTLQYYYPNYSYCMEEKGIIKGKRLLSKLQIRNEQITLASKRLKQGKIDPRRHSASSQAQT